MSSVLKVRLDAKELKRANRVTKRLGTSTQEMVRVFVTKIARTGSVPFELSLPDDASATPWEQRSQALESFYDSAKAW
jgi:addiction module RelB/DinJ family antitoxin